MAGLTGTQVKNTYGDVLNMGHAGAGVDATLRQVLDGLGTGTPLYISTTTIGFAGSITAQTDNTYDIGATGATRPRTGYFATSLVVGTATVGGSLTAPASSSGAGVDFTLRGSDAHDGNGNGGNLVLTTGLKNGSGQDGQILAGRTGAGAAPAYSFAADALTGLWLNGSTNLVITCGGGGANVAQINGAAIRIQSTVAVAWSSGDPTAVGADVGLKRLATKVVSVTDGSSGGGWIQNTAGRARMTTAPTNATATLSSGVLTDLTLNVVAGRKYTGKLVLFCKNSTAAEGLQVDFNGGNATVTSTQFGIASAPGATVGTATSTAIGTAVTLSNMGSTADIVVTVEFEIVVNAAGTLIPRFAEVSHTTGTATVEIGSYFWLEDSPN